MNHNGQDTQNTRDTRSTKERWNEQLSAYLDGELTPAEARALKEQIAEQPDLRQELEEMRMTREIMQSVPLQTPPRNYLLTPSMVAAEKPSQAQAPRSRQVAALTVAPGDVVDGHRLCHHCGAGLHPRYGATCRAIDARDAPGSRIIGTSGEHRAGRDGRDGDRDGNGDGRRGGRDLRCDASHTPRSRGNALAAGRDGALRSAGGKPRRYRRRWGGADTRGRG